MSLTQKNSSLLFTLLRFAIKNIFLCFFFYKKQQLVSSNASYSQEPTFLKGSLAIVCRNCPWWWSSLIPLFPALPAYSRLLLTHLLGSFPIWVWPRAIFCLFLICIPSLPFTSQGQQVNMRQQMWHRGRQIDWRQESNSCDSLWIFDMDHATASF